MKYGRRLVLTIIAISVLLVGPSIGVAQAAYLPYAHVVQTQSFDRAENNHTYVYAEGIADNWYYNKFLVHEEDISYDYYSYSRNSWSRSDSSYDGPAERVFSWNDGSSANWGWYCDSIQLPRFYDFVTDNYDSYIGSSMFYEVFPLMIGQEDTLFMEPGYIYIGTFNVTDEEFFHMTVTSHQADVEMWWAIYDGQGRALLEGGLDNGAIEVSPFASHGNGTYHLIISFESGDQAQMPVDILLESVVPETIAFGDIVEGTLPGSKEQIAEDGSVIFQELRPNVHTYKFSANSTEYGCLTMGMNTPGFMISYNSFMMITSDIMMDSSQDHPYEYWPNIPSDVFYYNSFGNETYYITVQGMDNIDYFIMNERVELPSLPLNEEFFIQNWQSIDWFAKAYKLNLGQDSVLRVNGTEWGSGYDWTFYTIKDNGLIDSLSISEGSSFQDASTMVVPAGEYIVIARAQGTSASGLYEFNLAPIINGVGNINVADGSLLGVRVPVEAMMFYRSNLTLITLDNVSASIDVDFINQCGLNEFATNIELGNRQSGTSWLGYGANLNTTSYELGLSSTSYSQFCDGYLIIVVAPYDVWNNTAGGGNTYHGYALDFSLTFDEDADRILTDEATATVGSTFTWSNFTLASDGDNDELYALRLNAPVGTWLNLSIYGEDMDDLDIYLYQNMDGCPIYLPWTSLDDTLQGTITTEASVEFGTASSEVLIIFVVDRTLSDEGSLDIGIQPYTTNVFEWMQLPDYYNYGSVPGPAPAPMDPALAIGGVAVVAIVVVVVVVVYLKKKGSI